MAPAPFNSLEKTWLRSRPGHSGTHTLALTPTLIHPHQLKTDKDHFPLTNEQIHSPVHPHTRTPPHQHTHTLEHTYIHTKRVISTPTCFAHSCANDFQHIYNYCKCVQNFRPTTNAQSPIYPDVWVLAIREPSCESVCVCVSQVNIRFYRLLLFAGFLLPLGEGRGMGAQRPEEGQRPPRRVGEAGLGKWGDYRTLSASHRFGHLNALCWGSFLGLCFFWFLGLFPLPYLMFGPCPVSISHQSHLVNLVLCSDHFGYLSDCWSGPGGPSPRKYVCGMLMSSDLLWPR